MAIRPKGPAGQIKTAEGQTGIQEPVYSGHTVVNKTFKSIFKQTGSHWRKASTDTCSCFFVYVRRQPGRQAWEDSLANTNTQSVTIINLGCNKKQNHSFKDSKIWTISH